jgi:hypothetical protein
MNIDLSPLPVELQELELELSRRAFSSPSPLLRQKLLDGVHHQLRMDEQARDVWRFIMAMAAAMLVWLNLSMSATQATDFGFLQVLHDVSYNNAGPCNYVGPHNNVGPYCKVENGQPWTPAIDAEIFGDPRKIDQPGTPKPIDVQPLQSDH